MHAFKPVKGGVWAAGSIGCAEWTGVKLADVLKQMGVDEDTTQVGYVISLCCVAYVSKPFVVKYFNIIAYKLSKYYSCFHKLNFDGCH